MNIINYDDIAKYDDPLIIFLHIPKTGGTSFVHILEDIYPNRIIRGGVAEINNRIKKRTEDTKVICGHFVIGSSFYKNIYSDTVHITLFRDPVERAISHYNYVRNTPSHPNHNQCVENSIMDLYNKGMMSYVLSNAQISAVSGMSHHTSGGTRLHYARRHLNDFTFFGFTEKFNEFLTLCKYKFGWGHIKPTILNYNGDYPAVSDEERELLGRYNKEDITFYKDLMDKYEQTFRADINRYMLMEPVIPEYQEVRARAKELKLPIPKPEDIIKIVERTAPLSEIAVPEPVEEPVKVAWYKRIWNWIRRK